MLTTRFASANGSRLTVLFRINVLLERKVEGEVLETYGRNSRKLREFVQYHHFYYSFGVR